MDREFAKKAKDVEISGEIFDRAKQHAEAAYKKIEKVFCPYFGCYVKFNTKGLDHIKFKDWERSRKRSDQYMRLKFVPLAPKILVMAHTLQGIHTEETYVRKKNYGSWDEVLNRVCFYEFIYVHKEKIRLKIIVRKDGGGEHYFYSIIPFWKMDKERGKKVLCDGDPLCD